MSIRAFISYKRSGQILDKRVAHFHELLESELRYIDSGSQYSSTRSMGASDVFPDVLREQVEAADVLIVLLSPAWLESNWCRKEYTLFSAKEQSHNHTPRILPVLWVKTPQLDNPAGDDIAEALSRVNYHEFERLRHFKHDDTAYSQQMAALAKRVKKVAARLKIPTPGAFRVYLSSTYGDLRQHREAVYETLRQLNTDVIAMEDYVATDVRPVDRCLADVEASDVYIGVFGWRYGYVPPHDNPRHLSITELEYRRARELHKPCLLFLVDEEAAVPPQTIDRVTGDGDSGARITNLREEILENHIVVFFRNPEELASRVSISLVHLLAQSQEQPQRLNEAKLIMVGHGAVGKTSLVNRLVNDSFDRFEQKTEGIQITKWQISVADDEQVRLNIWDFGGQEIMHSTHLFFLSQRSLYVLVLSGRQGHEDADAEYWLNLITSFGADSPIIVVLNKIKEHYFDLDRVRLQQKYPAIRDFVTTDCRGPADNDPGGPVGIDDLQHSIRRETERLEHLNQRFPRSWFQVKERLESMSESYLSFDQFRDICKDQGVTESADQESLASFLHILGVALNFREDLRLRDTHVLNPQWVTNGIYAILNSDILAKQEGVIFRKQVSAILDSRRYPERMHAFILDLMRKFELCFSFPEEEEQFLIPELLPKRQPFSSDEFSPALCLQFQYHYSVLPEGLLPRFIVRTHVLSTQLPRWRTGVVLEFEGNRALVRADLQDKCVFVAIVGATSGRRRLLAIIRSDFDHIHRSFKPQPQEMIPVPGHPELTVSYRELLVMEENNVTTFPKVAGSELLELDVQECLNGVDLQGERHAAKPVKDSRHEVRLFYSYSHKDDELRSELETHLKLLQRRGLIEPWHDRRISAGEAWGDEIDENLERADIILLLVSADFLASDYCYDIELKRALERNEEGAATVIPIIIRDVSWASAPFASLQAVPEGGKAVSTWENRDTAWKHVAEAIESVVEKVRIGKERSRHRH